MPTHPLRACALLAVLSCMFVLTQSAPEGIAAPSGSARPIVTPLSASPTGVDVDPSTHLVYAVSNGGAGYLDVIDGRDGTLVKSLTLSGIVTAGVVVDPSTHIVYVSDDDDAIVLALDGATLATKAVIDVGANPAGMAVDPPGTASTWPTPTGTAPTPTPGSR